MLNSSSPSSLYSHLQCSQSFFYSTSRRLSISSALNDFLKTHDIICLQETHLAPHESHALSSLLGCSISRNSVDINRAGTLMVDTPNILKCFNPIDIVLPIIAKGHAQLRRYIPLDSSHSPFQIFNLYLKSGGDFAFNTYCPYQCHLLCGPQLRHLCLW